MEGGEASGVCAGRCSGGRHRAPRLCPQLLETKILKLEQLVRLKDAKIQALQARVQGTSGGAEGAAKWTPPQQQHQQPEEAGVGAQQ